MQLNLIQLYLLLQNQVLVIRTGMELTRQALPFRTGFKKAMGLSPRASHLEVLIAVGQVYKQNGMLEKFFEYINRPSNLMNGNPLVTPEMLS